MRKVSALLVCLSVVTWLAAGFQAAVGEEATPSPTTIRLSDCRIKLIDQVTLASDRVGILRFVEPEEGEVVEAKQKIAGLEDDLIQSELAAAEHQAQNDIEVRASKKARELAETEYDRARQANRDVKNTVPLIELHRLKLAAEKAALEIELAEHELVSNRLQWDLKRTELATYSIVAPFHGVVTKVYKQRGEAVRQGDPILELTNTDHVRVEGWVDLDYAWRISLGNRVEVRLDVPDVDLAVEERVFQGRITFVDVSVQPVTRQTKVFAEVVNEENILRAGLTAEMSVALDSQEKQALSAHAGAPRTRSRDKISPTSRPAAANGTAKTAAPKGGPPEMTESRRTK